MSRGECLKVSVHPALKDKTVFDLCIVALTGLELHFPLEVDIPCSKKTFIQIGIKSPDGHTQFRVVCYDLVRRLSLGDERGDDHILLPQFMLCHTDAGTGIGKELPVLSVSEPCIIAVFVGDGAMIYGFRTSVADIRCLIEAVTAFPYKVRTGLVTGRTGSALYITEDDLTAYVSLPAAVTVDTEVMGIVESAFMIPVTEPVSPDLFGDGGRVFAQVLGDLFEGKPLV